MDIIKDLTDAERRVLVKELIPFIREEMSFKAKDTPLGRRCQGANATPIKFDCVGGDEITVKNPLHRSPEGCMRTFQSRTGSVRLKREKSSSEKLVFDISNMSAGDKVEALIY